MQIECDKCHTKYNLDEAQVPDEGRKVRCSKCKNIFTVLKPTMIAEPSPVGASPKAPETAPRKAQREQMTFPTGDMDAMEEEPQIDSGEHDDNAMQFLWGSEEGAASADEMDDYAPPPPPPKRGVPKPLVMAVGAVAVIGLLFVLFTQFKLGSMIFGKPEHPMSNLFIDQAGLRGEWERNSQLPRIFVVKGSVHNRSKKPKAFIKVRGVLLSKSKEKLEEVRVYCGNTISAKDLRTESPGDLQKRMNNRDGAQKTNTRIESNSTIPFTIVFFKVPDQADSFGVEVIEATIPES